MKPYQERVIKEYEEIFERHSKLAAFIESDDFHKVDPQERELLYDQGIAMLMYSRVLQKRIALWRKLAAAQEASR